MLNEVINDQWLNEWIDGKLQESSPVRKRDRGAEGPRGRGAEGPRGRGAEGSRGRGAEGLRSRGAKELRSRGTWKPNTPEKQIIRKSDNLRTPQPDSLRVAVFSSGGGYGYS